jgi:hypothetical protein
MDNSVVEKLKNSIANIEQKNSKIYFFVQDTKGNAKASIRYIYQIALTLKRAGYNAIILHEKPDYIGVANWLGEDYMKELPHKSVEGTNLEISPEDYLVIPEVFAFVMDQVKNLPCGKIVLCQAYDHMMETLQPGATWMQYGFVKCITTSETQKDFISKIMKTASIDILEPYIPDTFEKATLPAKPIVAVHAREQRDGLNFIKTFYLKYPQFRWVTFRDLRGLTEREFATGLKDCFLSIWIDPTSAFGTFPLESMKVGVPVIGQVPNLTPAWMKEENGIWLENPTQLADITADFIQNWIEDNIKPELFSEIETTAAQFSDPEKFNNKVVELFDSYLTSRKGSFELQLNKLNETVEA